MLQRNDADELNERNTHQKVHSNDSTRLSRMTFKFSILNRFAFCQSVNGGSVWPKWARMAWSTGSGIIRIVTIYNNYHKFMTLSSWALIWKTHHFHNIGDDVCYFRLTCRVSPNTFVRREVKEPTETQRRRTRKWELDGRWNRIE